MIKVRRRVNQEETSGRNQFKTDYKQK